MAEGRMAAFTGWGRVIDYLFGRNALIAVASFMLLLISGYATWSGMQDFIVGVSSTGAAQGREVPGGFTVSHDFLVVAVTVALTFLMWLALRETFGAQRRWTERLITFPLYLFLALWSIGFGYGFWWSLISGQEATRTSLSSLQEDARDASAAVAARLDAVRGQLDSVVSWSDSQMAREETSGGSCGVPSGAGRGPLYNARRSVRDSVTTLRDNVVKSWLTPLQADLEALRAMTTAVEGTTTEERQRRFEQMASQIRGRARNIASRSNELGASTAAEMRAIAQAVAAAPGQAGFSCHDPTLAQRLRQAADQAAEPAKLQLRQAAFNEGPAGVANAVKNLWANIGAYLSSLAVWVFSAGKSTLQHTHSGDPITGRDMIALLATIGIDLGLLALAMLDPPHAAPIRRDGLAATQARLHLPPPAVVRQLASAFETAIGRARGADLEWVRRHFIHHGGASYFVIPNLYSADRKVENEMEKALAINQLAGVFDDLKLIRAPSPTELKRLGQEEMRASYTDLRWLREEGRRGVVHPTSSGWFDWLPGRRAAHGPFEDRTRPDGQPPGRIRNHGLFSKAERALEVAGWSETARRDAEIFVLVDTEGLTPLLTLLNEATLAKGREAAEAAALEAASAREKSVPLLEDKRGKG